MTSIIDCKVFGNPLRGKQTKYCSNACKNKALQSYPAQKRRGLARKLMLIDQFGNSCSLCGYDNNLAALTFHHMTDDKLFKLDMRSLSNRTFDAVRDESKKCILLCHNCHAELHNPNLDLASLFNEAGRSDR